MPLSIRNCRELEDLVFFIYLFLVVFLTGEKCIQITCSFETLLAWYYQHKSRKAENQAVSLTWNFKVGLSVDPKTFTEKCVYPFLRGITSVRALLAPRILTLHFLTACSADAAFCFRECNASFAMLYFPIKQGHWSTQMNIFLPIE